ncbi:MAG: GDSL-type esterase/lipase family protein [Bacteroidales bacterium]
MQRYKHILLTTGLIIVCVALVCISVKIYANAVSAGILTKKDELKVVVPIVDIPKTFRGMGENILHDESNSLATVFKKLRKIRKAQLSNNILEISSYTSEPKDTLRVLHIGDSHIRGHVYPRTVKDMLAECFGSIVYRDFGINGATCNSYLNSRTMQQICTYTSEQEDNPLLAQSGGSPFEIKDNGTEDKSVGDKKSDNQIFHGDIIAKHHKPDLIILSFGTNESYGRYYNADEHYKQIDALVKALNEAFPGTPLLLTTPTGCYKAHRTSYKTRVLVSNGRHSKHGRKSRRYKTVTRTRTTYSENPFNAPCAATIVKYAKDNNLAYWDLYTISGGRESACRNWTSAGLMRADHVHFIPEGYTLQGQLLYCALIKEYNK